ncbi:MAG: hypothetical protein ACOYJB_07675 [Christensenellaceae bacterium]
MDDAVILAMARENEAIDIRMAMSEVAMRNPAWLVNAAQLPGMGGNPAGLRVKRPAYEPPKII